MFAARHESRSSNAKSLRAAADANQTPIVCITFWIATRFEREKASIRSNRDFLLVSSRANDRPANRSIDEAQHFQCAPAELGLLPSVLRVHSHNYNRTNDRCDGGRSQPRRPARRLFCALDCIRDVCHFNAYSGADRQVCRRSIDDGDRRSDLFDFRCTIFICSTKLVALHDGRSCWPSRWP